MKLSLESVCRFNTHFFTFLEMPALDCTLKKANRLEDVAFIAV